MTAFSWHHLWQWQIGVLPTGLLLVAVLLYLVGSTRAASWSWWRTSWFLLGALVTFIATQSVLGVYDMSSFAVHMMQHLLLIMVAAPLFALSRPLDLLAEAGPQWARAAVGSSAMRVLTHPLVAFVAYFIFIPLTHVTGLFQLMMQHMWVHHLEQIGFLVVGYFFFRVAFGSESGRRLHPGLRVVFVMAAVPVDTFTGLTIVMTGHLPYAGYMSNMPMGTSVAQAMSNYHLGGAIMWIGGDALMLLACIPMVVHWVRWETKNTKSIDAELDRLGL